MNLSASFYKDLKMEYIFALVAVFVMAVAGACLVFYIFRNKKLKMGVKCFCSFLLLAAFVFVEYHLVSNAVLMKKDLDQKTVIYYSGQIEVVEAHYSGWKPTGDVTICIEGVKYRLRYTDDVADFKAGQYIGKIVYSKNTEAVMFFEATPIEK